MADSLYSQLKHARQVATTADATAFGVEIGIVTNVKDPDKQGRVKVCFPRLPGKPESDWARVAQPAAGDGRGFYWIPHVNDEVLIGFERGQTNRPFVIGSLWNGKDKPMKTAYVDENTTVMIQTKSGHQIVISDKNGEEKIIIGDMSGKRTVTFDVKAKKFLIEAKEGDVELHAEKKLVLECEDLEIKTSKTGKADIGTTFDLNISQKGGIQAGPVLNIKASKVELNPSGGAGAAAGGSGGTAAGARAGAASGGSGGAAAGAGGGAAPGAGGAGGAAAGAQGSATVPTHDVTKPPAAGGAAGATGAAGGAAGTAGAGAAGASAGGAGAAGTAGAGGAGPAGTAGAGAAQAGGGAAAAGGTATGASAAPTKKPTIVSFTASQEAEPGEKAEEFESDISVPDDTDVIFKYEVTDADVVILSREGRELGQFKEQKHEVPVRPPSQHVTTYTLTARNALGDRTKDFHVKAGTGPVGGIFDHVQITPEMTVWKSEEFVLAHAEYVEITAQFSLKLNGVFEVSRVSGPRTLDELVPLLIEKLKGAYSGIRLFLDRDFSNMKIHYEGSNLEITPAADGSKYGGEIKYDWTFKITKGDFEMEGQGQLIFLSLGKNFKHEKVGSGEAEKPKVLHGAIEFSKIFDVAAEFAVKPGEIICKDLGVKAALTIEFAPQWAKLGAQLLESGGAELALLGAAITGTVLTWVALGYSVQVNGAIGSLQPTATDLATSLWNAYWAGVTKPDEYYKTDGEPEEKAYDEGKRRGKLFRDKLRQSLPDMSDADFQAAAADALPGIFQENEAAIRKDMMQHVFLLQAKVLIWKNYVEQYALDLTFASEDQRRREGWGALFGEFPREKGDMAALYHYKDTPGSENSMNVPWP